MRELATYPITDDEIIAGLTRLIDDLATDAMPGDMRTTLLRAALERVRRYPTAPAGIGENMAAVEAGRTGANPEREAKALIRRTGLGFRDAIRVLMTRRMADYHQTLRITGRAESLESLMTKVAEEAGEGRVPEAIAFALLAAGVDPASEAVTDELLNALLRSGGAWPRESVMRAARRLVEEDGGLAP